jgi:hypothetical protein
MTETNVDPMRVKLTASNPKLNLSNKDNFNLIHTLITYVIIYTSLK